MDLKLDTTSEGLINIIVELQCKKKFHEAEALRLKGQKTIYEQDDQRYLLVRESEYHEHKATETEEKIIFAKTKFFDKLVDSMKIKDVKHLF